MKYNVGDLVTTTAVEWAGENIIGIILEAKDRSLVEAPIWYYSGKFVYKGGSLTRWFSHHHLDLKASI